MATASVQYWRLPDEQTELVAYLVEVGPTMAMPIRSVPSPDKLRWSSVDVALREPDDTFLITPAAFTSAMKGDSRQRHLQPERRHDARAVLSARNGRGNWLMSTSLSCEWADFPAEFTRWGKRVMQWVRKTVPDWYRNLVTGFLPASAPPSADAARSYLLEGALFDERPVIALDGEAMSVRYDRTRKPMTLRRLHGDDADAARAEAVALATLGGRDDLAAALGDAATIVEWEVERSELDEDAWFALHLWQAWMLRPSGGWLHAPGDGLFDAALQRLVAAR